MSQEVFNRIVLGVIGIALILGGVALVGTRQVPSSTQVSALGPSHIREAAQERIEVSEELFKVESSASDFGTN